MSIENAEFAGEMSSEIMGSSSEARTSPSMLPSLLGTWTLQTHAKSDLGYYKGSAFVVMHVMVDPLQSYACTLPKCDERENQFCQRNVNECVDMKDAISQWSDVSVFYQFGFEVESGTYPFRMQVSQNTSDWIGPYNLVLPQHSFVLESRYVATIATDYLTSPINNTIVEPQWFDQYAGATAVHQTMAKQADILPTQDPYAKQLETCDEGSVRPILPRLSLSHNKNMQLDFLLLSLPSSNSDPALTKAWPSLQKHLPDLGIVGPYCFQGHLGAYAINASFNTQWGAKNNTWKLTPGCVQGLPCWPSEHPPKPHGGGHDGPSSNTSRIWSFCQDYGLYILLVVCVISMTMNCQLSYQLQQEKRRRRSVAEEGAVADGTSATPQRRRRILRRVVSTPAPNGATDEMAEPLLTTIGEPTSDDIETVDTEKGAPSSATDVDVDADAGAGIVSSAS